MGSHLGEVPGVFRRQRERDKRDKRLYRGFHGRNGQGRIRRLRSGYSDSFQWAPGHGSVLSSLIPDSV